MFGMANMANTWMQSEDNSGFQVWASGIKEFQAIRDTRLELERVFKSLGCMALGV